MAEPDRDRIVQTFFRVVNMSADEIEAWLETPESARVGQRRDGAAESIGQAAGRRTAAILRMPRAALSAEDYCHMRRVAGFVARHRAQEPVNIVTSRWRWALMNWGHDR